MKRNLSLTLVSLSAALTFSSCYTNPVTGRRGLSLVDETQMRQMADQQYVAFLSENRPVSASSRDAEMVKRVGTRIANGVRTYMNSIGQQAEINGYQWEFNLVNNNEANAWCMPGGKVVVYSGILPLTQNEAGLAIVMGHEIGHAIAHHSNERMSQQMALQFGSQTLSSVLSSRPSAAANIFNAAVGVGGQLGSLKFARNQESEADRMGLIFAALAGYNPNEAIPFWQRMAAASGGNKPPEFLSTHPSDETRINNIRQLLPEAMKYYRPQGK
ncbi:MAG: M48 family peptidase [Sphingobacteriales bacterium]|nr:MAG: M48 family peptidase [Sphingobacteriales bacterium]